MDSPEVIRDPARLAREILEEGFFRLALRRFFVLRFAIVRTLLFLRRVADRRFGFMANISRIASPNL